MALIWLWNIKKLASLKSDTGNKTFLMFVANLLVFFSRKCKKYQPQPDLVQLKQTHRGLAKIEANSGLGLFLCVVKSQSQGSIS